MSIMIDERQERDLLALDRQRRASRTRMRYRALRHPWRFGCPSPSRLRQWKASGYSTRAKARTPWGQQITVTLPDDVSVALRWNGFFEYDLSAFYLRMLRPGMTFVDIGAHVGYFSLLASRAVGPTGRVVSFEPTPSTFEVLVTNARAHRNVTVVNAAVWSEPTAITLRDYGPCFSAYNSVFQARLPAAVKAGLTERTHSVQAVRLDDYVRERGCAPDAVKIDVESAEMHVLLGMQEVLIEHRPVVSLEVGDMDLPGVPRSRELIEKVVSFGYRSYELQDGRLRPHVPRDAYSYENIVFVPAERAGEF
jgi:FkbM family methyltransferase